MPGKHEILRKKNKKEINAKPFQLASFFFLFVAVNFDCKHL